MCSATSKIPDSGVTDGLSQSSDLTLCIKAEEVVEVSCGVRADDGRHAFAEIASEARGEDYYIGNDFCAVLEAKAGFCV